MKGMFASCKRRARRLEVLPVPPVRRIVIALAERVYFILLNEPVQTEYSQYWWDFSRGIERLCGLL